MNEMTQRLNGFVTAWQSMVDQYVATTCPNLAKYAAERGREHYYEVQVVEGKRYWKIVAFDGNQHSCRAFIDRETGAIYKAATWRAPAKHIRGYITAPDFGMSCMTNYGPQYLR